MQPRGKGSAKAGLPVPKIIRSRGVFKRAGNGGEAVLPYRKSLLAFAFFTACAMFAPVEE
jgi:hypothetical protein